MTDLPTVALVLALLVPAMSLVVRLPDHLTALFAGRDDDAWPPGVQEEIDSGFQWVPNVPREDHPATTKVVPRFARRS